MIHILLLILKIIGIILGVLFGIVLLGIILVLFVPVRYTINASRTEGEGNPPAQVTAKISWLLHIINIKAAYPAEVWLRARVLFITVFRLPKKEKARPEQENAGAEKEKAPPELENAGAEKEKAPPEQENAGAEERKAENVGTAAGEENASAVMAETGTAADAAEQPAESELPAPSVEKKKKRRSPKFSLKGLWKKISAFFQNIWYTIRKICDRIKSIWENIEYYLDILRSDTFKSSYELCKDELHTVFSYIRPRKIQADLAIGLDDPASTAKILSYYGILYPLIGNHVTIVPDFDKKRIEGTVFIKGKIRMFTFIKAAVRIYFNKDIKRLIRLFMKEDV
ncbi:MAG: DUF2953 domain-containing protein [Ruminococcus sp.]|nr:DUF2953 domain-containing protein [Ruminococcus sp.]